MGFRPRRWVQRLVRGRVARQWAMLARTAGAMPGGRLRGLQAEALPLRRDLNRFLAAAEQRLRTGRAADAPNLPAGTDWRWRPGCLSARITPAGVAAPQPGTRLGDEAAIWHDCATGAIILRQVPNRGAADLSPFGLQLETLGFAGSFLSIAIDLPPAAVAGLTRSHIIRVDAVLGVERPMSIYARLNISHGPNTDELLSHLGDLIPGAPQGRVIEFDLHYVEMNEKRLEKLWLDLIFEAPRMNSVVLHDLFLSRHLRAEI